ncbi:MAG: ParB N-terminal domain-containing protein [Proteobacteria bacterium]|nr:hypothetical protein [Desulfobacula sp.]MBU3951506.1 ParB N-terminal domain-containing protein [Pseudomonadota bacterium]
MNEFVRKESHEIMEISPYDILADEGLRPRATTYELTIYEYAEALEKGITLPPIDIYSDGKVYLLADGYYRLEAYKLVKFDSIPAIVHQGGRKEALIHALGSNTEHGVRRTNADKAKAVTMALTDPDIGKTSNNQIALICGTSQPYVGKIRKRLTCNGYKFGTTRTCSDGRVMNISGIGTKQETIPAPIEREAPAVEENNDEVTGPSENGDQENLEDQESNPETNVDKVPGDNDLGTGTQGDANIPPEPVDNNSEAGGSEDDDEETLDTQDNAPDSDDVTDFETTETDPAPEVDDLEEPETVDSETSDEVVIEEVDEIPGSETDSQDMTQNESGDEGNDPDSDDTTELGAGENDPDDNVDTDDEEPEIELEQDPEPDEDADPENVPPVIEPPDTSDLDGIDPDDLKLLVVHLQGTTKKQEEVIEAKNNHIADLEQQVEELKSENECLKIQLQARAKTESETSAFLDINEMNKMDEEEDAYSMA